MTDSKECPKCGHSSDQPFEECPKCGIVVQKFLERENNRKGQERLEEAEKKLEEAEKKLKEFERKRFIARLQKKPLFVVAALVVAPLIFWFSYALVTGLLKESSLLNDITRQTKRPQEVTENLPQNSSRATTPTIIRPSEPHRDNQHVESRRDNPFMTITNRPQPRMVRVLQSCPSCRGTGLDVPGTYWDGKIIGRIKCIECNGRGSVEKSIKVYQ